MSSRLAPLAGWAQTTGQLLVDVGGVLQRSGRGELDARATAVELRRPVRAFARHAQRCPEPALRQAAARLATAADAVRLAALHAGLSSTPAAIGAYQAAADQFGAAVAELRAAMDRVAATFPRR